MKRATGASAHARIGNAAGVGRAARAAHQWADASGVEERRPRYAVRTQRSATRTPARCRATAAARVHSASALRWPGRESTRSTVAGARAGRGCRDARGVWFSADGSRDVGVCVYVCVCVCMCVHVCGRSRVGWWQAGPAAGGRGRVNENLRSRREDCVQTQSSSRACAPAGNNLQPWRMHAAHGRWRSASCRL